MNLISLSWSSFVGIQSVSQAVRQPAIVGRSVHPVRPSSATTTAEVRVYILPRLQAPLKRILSAVLFHRPPTARRTI